MFRIHGVMIIILLVCARSLITCIYNLNSYLILLIFMLILCEYNACYHSFYEFSPLVCYFTKVHNYALFRDNYVLY